MATIRAQFGELNTDLPSWRLADGVADVATNVIVRNGKLQRRPGFVLTDGAATTVVRMIQGPGGTLYTTTTASSLFIWWNRVYAATAAGLVFATAADFSATTAGGLPRASGQLGAAATADGHLDGEYHVYYSLYNSETKEESLLSLPQDAREPLQSRASDGFGGVQVTTRAVQAGYAYDKTRLYVSRGVSERLVGRVVTFEAYRFAEVTKGAAATHSVTASEASFGSPGHERHLHNGGLPPSTAVACFDGKQAVYALNSDGDVEFSLPGFPTMIPRTASYSDSGSGWSWAQTTEPSPWRGDISRATPGAGVVAVCGGGLILIATADATVRMVRTESSRLFPVDFMEDGSPSAQGAVGHRGGIFMLGNERFYRITSDGVVETSLGHWSSTLLALSDATTAVVAHFPAENQVWLADQGDIWIIDATSGFLLSKFDVTGIGVVQAMCPFQTSSGEQVMKIASSTGIWTYDPDDTTTYLDNASGFDASWRGYFVNDRGGVDVTAPAVSFDLSVNTGAGGDDDGTVTVSAWGKQRSGETFTVGTVNLSGANRHDLSNTEITTYIVGHALAVSISSVSASNRRWVLDDLFITYDSERA